MDASLDESTGLNGTRRLPLATKIVLIGSLLALFAGLAIRTKGKLDKKPSAALGVTAGLSVEHSDRTPMAFVSGTPEQWRPRVKLEGTLQPAMDVDLGFRAPGQLSQIKVRLGSLVKQGTVLAALDTDAAMAQRAVAEAQVRGAEAQLALAEDAERRTSKMNAAGAVAEQTAVQAKNQAGLARAQLDAAKAQLQLAQANLDNHLLKAPFGGYVTQAPTALGSIVGAGTPLFHLTDVQKLRLVGTIGETDAGLAEVGAEVEVGLEGRMGKGRVTAVLPILEAATRRVRVEAEIDNDVEPHIRAGSFVRASIIGTRDVSVLRLPGTVIRPGTDDELLVEVDGKLRAKRVALGVLPEGDVLVRAGLTPSDRVLLQPTTSDRDGKEVGP